MKKYTAIFGFGITSEHKAKIRGEFFIECQMLKTIGNFHTYLMKKIKTPKREMYVDSNSTIVLPMLQIENNIFSIRKSLHKHVDIICDNVQKQYLEWAVEHEKLQEPFIIKNW